MLAFQENTSTRSLPPPIVFGERITTTGRAGGAPLQAPLPGVARSLFGRRVLALGRRQFREPRGWDQPLLTELRLWYQIALTSQPSKHATLVEKDETTDVALPLHMKARHDTTEGGHMSRAVEQLRRLSTFEKDWDSYGGEPPTAQAIERAEQIILEMADRVGDKLSRRSEPWGVIARGDGGVILEWRAPKLDLEVHLEPNGTLGYLLDETIDGASRYTDKDLASWSEVEALLSRVILSSLE
jgi:hypothetical protein